MRKLEMNLKNEDFRELSYSH